MDKWTVFAAALANILLPVLCLCIEIPLFISILKQFYCTAGQRITKWNKCTSILVFVFNIAGHVIIIPYGILWISNRHIILVATVLIYGANISFYIGTYCIYTLLLLRVYYTFELSVYRIKTWKLYLHGLNAVLSLIVIVLVNIAGIYAIYLFGAWIILLTVGYAHFFYTFSHNLFSLVLAQQRSTFIGNMLMQKELNERQRNMLCTVRKHTILGTFMILGNLLCVVIVVSSVSLIMKFDGNGTLMVILICLYMISVYMFGVVGPVCIYLGLQQNRDSYRKWCSLCDRKCTNICIALAERRMNELNEPSDYLQMVDQL